MREEDISSPPPLPSHHPSQKGRWKESLRIPAFFYLELIFGATAIVVVAPLGARLVPALQVFVYVLLGLLFLSCFYRMIRRVAADNRLRGKPRLAAILVFLGALFLPAAVAGWVANKHFKRELPEVIRQAEAKAGLQKVLGAQRAFRKEFGKFTLNTRELSSVSMEGLRPRYVLGFPTVCSVKYGVDAFKAQWIVDDPTFLRDRKLEIDDFFKNARKAEECIDPRDGFEAYAVGVIREGAPLDVWRIDHLGRLENVQQGF